MSRVTGDIPNLINGVSQQAVALRLPTQAKAQENCYATIVNGLMKRPPADQLARIFETAPANASFHIIDRDENEKYVAVFTSSSVRVFDFNGVEKTVTAPTGFGYLSTITDPTADLRVLTVADHSFVVNRKRVVAQTSDTSAAYRREAIAHVVQGNYTRTYAIYLDGVLAASYGTPSSSGIAPEHIAEQLRLDFITRGYVAPTWNIVVSKHVIWIRKQGNANFSVSILDGNAGQSMKIMKGVVENFADLPIFAPDGTVMEVSGGEGNNRDSYWVTYVRDLSGDDTGLWEECLAPGTPLGLDPATMPHLLAKLPDGNFEFKRAVWNEREVGNLDRAPNPSFVGNTISDAFFHRNRLGLLSDESVCLSRAGSYFDFFRTSLTALLDDDPIDVAAAHIKVAFLHHAVPFQDNLILFSGETQFRLSGNDLLTPKTVSIRPLTEYSCSPRVRPVAVGPSIFFAWDGPGWATVNDYTFDRSSQTADAEDVTGHVPQYVPGSLLKMVGSTDYNTLGVLSAEDRSALYVYTFYWTKEARAQSAWSRWSWEGTTILDVAIAQDGNFYAVVQVGTGVHIWRIGMDPAVTDDNFDYRIYLDRKVLSSALAAPTYDAGTNRSTYTLPYSASTSLRAVVLSGGTRVPGQELVPATASGLTVSFSGDLRGQPVMIGLPYESSYTFSRFYPRVPARNGALVAQQDGRLQVQYLSLMYDRTAHFKVRVDTVGRPDVEYTFNGRSVGSTQPIGQLTLTSGRFSVPIQSRSENVEITVTSRSWLPMNLVSARWIGIYNPSGRER